VTGTGTDIGDVSLYTSKKCRTLQKGYRNGVKLFYWKCYIL